MEKIPEKVTKKLILIPDKSGVYLMKAKSGKIIYIGKAKSLKKRIRSYFSDSHSDIKTEELVGFIAEFDYIITSNEYEALILESNLIKKYQPKYNVLLKDDKRYPFIKITLKEPFPRIFVTRDLKKDGSKYFGPYTEAGNLRKIIKMLAWIFPTRTCKRNIPSGKPVYKRACLNYQMGKCSAPCIGKISQLDYRYRINRIIDFLQGRNKDVIRDLKAEMSILADKLNFEEAAKCRDKIDYINKLNNRNIIIMPDKRDRDVIGIYKEENRSAVTVLKFFSGKLLNREIYPLDNIRGESVPVILKEFIQQYYADRIDKLPYRIILQKEPQDNNLLNNWLKNRLHIPKRGELKKLITIARENAFNFVEEQKLNYLRKSTRTIVPIKELKDKFFLPKLPRKIACFDVSTIQGSDTVSSLVFFENGKPKKANYRHYLIKSFCGQDDFAAMSETLSRYLNRIEENEKPDLIIVDGGKGQLNSAWQELKKRNITDINIISLAKRVEEIFLPGKRESIILSRSSLALKLLIRIRDEAHRFAVNYHRKKRNSRTLISELDKVDGINEVNKFMLLKAFHSISRIREASVDDLMRVKGIGEKTANKILKTLN